MITGIAQAPSPNHSSRRGEPVTATVIHYTAAGPARGSIRWLQMPESKASAHFVIARDGFVTQLVALSRRAWHAGVARLGASRRVNHQTIGVELANCGLLVERDGNFFWEQGRRLIWYDGLQPVRAVLGYPSDVRVTGPWEPYPAEQIAALRGLLVELSAAGYTEASRHLVGHDEVSGPDVRPHRYKIDPGPAFPWEEFSRSTLRTVTSTIC
ncbi:hypothetical protein LCGC14_1273250 [marine sediment metagenome]|uniref:N-acetylmuramoyl-L-alanine amidase n=1 Tax=marine sediment metagenome TaxID=412755 RepID=A0A0F9P0G7_9ZZZZ